ncbi:hypothetical protein DRW03_03055 [Corallococcus sp. H22C18031201]|nr:hypothetical protein DRW03_03055 [Corallococcus sp. H22C18031201]
MTLRLATWALVLTTWVGCAHPAAVVVPPPEKLPPLESVDAASAALTALHGHEPATFKMVHQVVARHDGKSYVMTGYLLGRDDGAFRVSAAADMGPRLFDVAWVGNQWEAKVHLRQLAERLDPRHMGRAVQRIYFTTASGPLTLEDGQWVSRANLQGDDDIDAVEVFRDGHTLALTHKRFFLRGAPVLDIDYTQLEAVQGHWLARHVKLKDQRGFELELSVSQYEPGFAVPEERLHVQP